MNDGSGQSEPTNEPITGMKNPESQPLCLICGLKPHICMDRGGTEYYLASPRRNEKEQELARGWLQQAAKDVAEIVRLECIIESIEATNVGCPSKWPKGFTPKWKDGAYRWIKDEPASGAASSEPQEWTPEYLDEILDLKFERGPVVMSVSDYCVRLQSVADNINAAIAAELEKREQAERALQGYDNRLIALGKESASFRTQLLQAQAAIEKHNKQWNCSWAGEIKPDLSALREHDAEVIEHDRFNRRDVLGWEQGYKCAKAEAAEVRRRLVDLLRLVAAHMRAHVTNEPLRKEVEAALAQVKDKT